MDEFLKPVVALEKIFVDHLNVVNTSNVKSLSFSKDTHVLYVNGTHLKSNTGLKRVEDLQEELLTENADHEKCSSLNEFLKDEGGSLYVKNHVDSFSKKRVSFSNRSKVLYFNKDEITNQLSESEISFVDSFPVSLEENDEFSDVAERTSSEPTVEPFHSLSADVDDKHPEPVSDKEQHLQLKDLIVTLEKLPKTLLEEMKSKNYIPKECSYNSASCTENLDIDEYSDSLLNESEDKKFAKNSKNMLDDEEQELESDIQPSNKVLTDLVLEGNICPLLQLKVSVERLPDNLLELHLDHYKSQNSDRVIYSESENCSSKAVICEDRRESAELNSSTYETMHNSEKEFSDSYRLLSESGKSSNHVSCDISIKNPFVLVERLNLVIPEVECIQQTEGPVEGEVAEENMFSDKPDDNSIPSIHKVFLPVKDSSHKSHMTFKEFQTASERSIRLVPCQPNEFLHSKKKCISSVSHRAKTSNRKVKLKSVLQEENGVSVTKVSDSILPSELTERISVDSQDVRSSSDTEIQCNFPEDRFVSHTDNGPDHSGLPSLQLAEINYMNTSHFSSNEQLGLESNNQKNICSSDEDELPLSRISSRKVSETSAAGNPGYLSDSSSLEDDIPLSQLCELNNMEQSKLSASLKKKLKKKTQKKESSVSHNNKFTDFNVLHMTEMVHQNPLALMPSTKRKSQKTFESKRSRIKNLHTKKKIILFSPMTSINNSDPLFSEIRKAALLADVKKASKNSPSLKKCQKPVAKKCMPSKKILEPDLTKISYVNTSKLVGKTVQNLSCENNSASNLKNIGTDHCYYGQLLAKTANKRNITPLKKVKLDHNYSISGNFYGAKQNKHINHLKNDVSNGVTSAVSKVKTSPKRTRKKKKDDHCKGKKKKTSDDPDVFLKTYLQKFCSDFDKLANKKCESSLSASASSHQKKQTNKDVAKKRKENAYRVIINDVHDHLKRTCSLRKSFKRQKIKDNLSVDTNEMYPLQLSISSFESENDCSMQPSHFCSTELNKEGENVSKGSPQRTQSKRNFTSKKLLKKSKESHIDKYRLGFLTKNRSLRLYNKCLVSERLLFSKYNMTKKQRRKLKKLFNALKNNSLDKNEL